MPLIPMCQEDKKTSEQALYRLLRRVMLYHCRFLNPRLKNTMCMSEFSGLFQLFSNFFDRRIQTLPIGRMKNRYTKTLFFLWHLVRIRGCSFQKVSHDLIELRGVLRGDDRRIGL